MASKLSSLKRRSEFEDLKKSGKKIFSAYIILNYKLNNMKSSRFGMTFSKKVGNAVTRNKLKRWTRDILRRELAQIKDNYDINVILRVTNDSEFFKKLKLPEFSQKLLSAITKVR